MEPTLTEPIPTRKLRYGRTDVAEVERQLAEVRAWQRADRHRDVRLGLHARTATAPVARRQGTSRAIRSRPRRTRTASSKSASSSSDGSSSGDPDPPPHRRRLAAHGAP